jgi:hypothetical protein
LNELTSGSHTRPSGQMAHSPQLRESRRPCVSNVENIRRPSAKGVGCSALPMVIGPIGVTLEPSQSMTKSWSVGLV